ncbi:MAG: hypothetical protein HYY44_08750 [Deltaproteobacteria bacterium]|nr:hypothetical protein [Deltaproteobacteria bacterium]MBI4374644.1 hypothetical protein [Deltaproteobacteria bacterium]
MKTKQLIMIAVVMIAGTISNLQAKTTTIGKATRINRVTFSRPVMGGVGVAKDLGRAGLTTALCGPGYAYAGQGAGCRAAISDVRVDSCNGEGAAESWWSCVLPQDEISCPGGGELEFGPTYYRCRYPQAIVKRSFACAEGYSMVLGEFCGPNGDYCCYKDGNPCGVESEFWASRADGDEACCAVWRQGPC